MQVDDTCVGHAYGDTATFFETTNCTGLSRALYSAQLDGGAVVVSVSRVRMPDTATARDLRGLTDRNGSGNVNDLLREGVSYSGGPAELSGAEYASAVSGPAVTIVESRLGRPGRGRERGRHRPDGGQRSGAAGAALPRGVSGATWPSWPSQAVAAAQAISDSSRAIAGRPRRPALCGVELISPNTACARARQVATSVVRWSRPSTSTHTST